MLDRDTLQSTHPKVFFGGDSAFGPGEHHLGPRTRLSRHLDSPVLSGLDLVIVRRGMNLVSQRWACTVELRQRRRVKPSGAASIRTKSLKNIKMEVELGFDRKLAAQETQRCLNCDVQTVFTDKLCIECDACVDICPMDCITFTPNQEEGDLRLNLTAPALNVEQDLYVSAELATGRVMVKDEDLCLHCGLCAERCPTNAWDMQKSVLHLPQLGSYAS